ncbi:unnamed protein product [Didymodactylos carnosus]|uniref:Uncharacterized protein n=1 Tax=Didymodactylos carnosus TaxID=1234261 RepID=A0A813W6G7_9BILA|nr:unnamed protein product [Didymodactylos carnosus]CAF1551978.1 unnamed protein product [Didymodactylos carnosus]CAF3638227.1 unnamed protein product [Didymodactylos carnosus]CAF4342314.1 unnamed protein product [Didymodactylos carnosus]
MADSVAQSDGGNDQEKSKRIFKIIVIGKTCLTFRFCSGKFPEKSEATIGVDFREKAVEIDDEILKLQIWDTAGQERFRRSMINHYYRNVHAIIYVYDVTNLATFESLPLWINECDKHVIDPEIPRVLVGNKCDVDDEQMVVQTSVAQRFADTNNMPLFETSAKADEHQDHVNSIFLLLAHKLKYAKPLMTQPKLYSQSLISIDRTNTNRQTNTTNSNLSENDGGYCMC